MIASSTSSSVGRPLSRTICSSSACTSGRTRTSISAAPPPRIHTRETLDRRFDDLESGKVQLIDGEEARQRLMEKTASTTSANTLRTTIQTRPTA
jgi:hypothetical protein